MDTQQEAIRAVDAKQLLEHPLFREAFEGIERRIITELRSADLSDDRRKRLNDLLVSLARVRSYIEQIAVTGDLIAAQIERDKSMTERMGAQLRRASWR